MRVGVDLPYFRHAVEIRDYVEAAQGLGYAHIGFSEHVVSSAASTFPPGLSFDEPWHESFTLLAFLAAITERIELNTGMTLLPLRPAALAAKQAAEVDLLSGGRLRLAVSVGWQRRELEAVGVDPSTRGSLIEEQIEVMRLLWTQDLVTYHGKHIVLDDVALHPRPERSIPIWMGGGNFDTAGMPLDVTIKRAARLADGFKMMAPLGTNLDGMLQLVDRLRAEVAAAGREPDSFGLEGRLVTHVTPPELWAANLRTMRESGVSHFGIANRIVAGTVADQIDLITRVADATRAEWGEP
ncbi:MAG: TIGR03619 family F420-dependent LLM class oxidoreductase [Actinomycetota bacterium]|nr:TIGR03619 family F420-dependent LLM class oxidoreductase [Actinomycetota bacterium]